MRMKDSFIPAAHSAPHIPLKCAKVYTIGWLIIWDDDGRWKQAMIREDQFAGCLIGQCLGDAIGFIVEGHPPDYCSGYVDEVVRAGKVHEARRRPYHFGQYSDDSQLARELLQSYVYCERFDPADYAIRIASIFAEDRVVGWGAATRAAARRLSRGASWEEAGTHPPAAGNGSAMRAGPIGLLFYNDSRRLVQAAHDQSRITHMDPRCSAGATIIAASVGMAPFEGDIDTDHFLQLLSELVAPFKTAFTQALQYMPKWIALEPDEAVRPISHAGLENGFQDHWQGISPFVVPSVLWSVYAFLRTPNDYWETICTAIAAGGDTDTTASMAGAISGARNGLTALPQALLPYLNDKDIWEIEDLTQLASKAYRIKHKNTM